MIEVTYCQNDLVNNLKIKQDSTMSLLQLLPAVKCVGPEDSLKYDQSILFIFIINCAIISLYVGEDLTIDKYEFKNKVFQCVFQYLRRFDAKVNLSDFTYKEPYEEGDYATCISTIIKFVFCYVIIIPCISTDHFI